MMRFTPLSMLLPPLALILTATLAYQLAAPIAEYEVVRRARTDLIPAVSLPEPFAPPPLREFDEIDERPLFIPERRPFRQPEVEAPPPEPRKPPAATLVGIIVDGKRRIALAKVGGKSVNLVPGTTIEGWSVVAIDADHVSFKAEDETYEIRLPKPVASPAQPRQPAQPRPSRMPPPPGYAPGQTPGQP